jgi:hypothetical protein
MPLARLPQPPAKGKDRVSRIAKCRLRIFGRVRASSTRRRNVQPSLKARRVRRPAPYAKSEYCKKPRKAGLQPERMRPVYSQTGSSGLAPEPELFPFGARAAATSPSERL